MSDQSKKRKNIVLLCVIGVIILYFFLAIYFIDDLIPHESDTEFLIVNGATNNITLVVSNAGDKDDRIEQIILNLPATNSLSANTNITCTTTNDVVRSITGTSYTFTDLDIEVYSYETSLCITFVPTQESEVFGYAGDTFTVIITFDNSATKTEESTLSQTLHKKFQPSKT